MSEIDQSILGAVKKSRICKTNLNISEKYLIIYWWKDLVNSTLCSENYGEFFCFEGHSVCMRHCTLLATNTT
jgi:hypothetical protein